MANLNISVLNERGEVKCQIAGEDNIIMVYQGEYECGDKIVFTTDHLPNFYVIRVDGAIDEAYVYLTKERIEYIIPFNEDKISYNPSSFTGERHYITMRIAKEQENGNYCNLAKNVMDQHEDQGCYPHVYANAETKGQIAALFAARNVIDGILANTCHWPWPFQSWGIDQRDDAEITVEFGRPVDIDKLWLYTRADFPHDSWWKQAVVTFSDGSLETLSMQKSVKPHVFSIKREKITWLRLGKLIRGDNSSPFPALTQIEVYGRNSQLD